MSEFKVTRSFYSTDPQNQRQFNLGEPVDASMFEDKSYFNSLIEIGFISDKPVEDAVLEGHAVVEGEPLDQYDQAEEGKLMEGEESAPQEDENESEDDEPQEDEADTEESLESKIMAASSKEQVIDLVKEAKPDFKLDKRKNLQDLKAQALGAIKG